MGLLEILMAIVAIIFTAYLWCRYTYSYWSHRGVPYVKPIPFLGNLGAMLTTKKNFSLYLSDIYKAKEMETEPVVGIYVMHKPALLLRDPEIIKTVLIRDFDKFPNRYASCDMRGDFLGYHNLFFARTPAWKEIRTKLAPVFSSAKLKQMLPLMQEIGYDLETHLASHRKDANCFEIDAKQLCSLFSTDLVASAIFGIRVHCLQDPNVEFRLQAKSITHFTAKQATAFFMVFFLPKLVQIFGIQLFPKTYCTYLRATLLHVISERARCGIVRNDLVDILMALRKDAQLESDGKDSMWTDDFVTAQAAVFLTAAIETATVMTFTLYELSRNPDCQARLRQEILDALTDGAGSLTYERIHSLEYLQMVIDETTRLYPALPLLNRECSAGALGFPLKSHRPLTVPDGMAVYIPTFALHRDAKYWCDPERFDPNRFSPENRKTHNPMTHLPFGNGPRTCIGNRFALLLVKVFLVHSLKNHYLTTCDRTQHPMSFEPKALILQCRGELFLQCIYDGAYDKGVGAREVPAKENERRKQ